MPKKPNALDLAGWRKSQMVVTPKGTRSMTQRELGDLLGIGGSYVSRIESGERWPTERVWEAIYEQRVPKNLTEPGRRWRAIGLAQLETWRAYPPAKAARTGKTP